MRSYGVGPDTVTMKIDVDDIPMDIDLSVPIGLIITELVSNAFEARVCGRAARRHHYHDAAHRRPDALTLGERRAVGWPAEHRLPQEPASLGPSDREYPGGADPRESRPGNGQGDHFPAHLPGRLISSLLSLKNQERHVGAGRRAAPETASLIPCVTSCRLLPLPRGHQLDEPLRGGSVAPPRGRAVGRRGGGEQPVPFCKLQVGHRRISRPGVAPFAPFPVSPASPCRQPSGGSGRIAAQDEDDPVARSNDAVDEGEVRGWSNSDRSNKFDCQRVYSGGGRIT